MREFKLLERLKGHREKWLRKILFFFMVAFSIPVFSQTVSLRNNVIYGARGILNLGVEVSTFTQQSLVLQVGYNPWEWGDNKKRQLLLFQPEYRYWFTDVYMGHFVGVQAHYAKYDYAKTTPLTTITNNRYDGSALGIGFTYGYQFILSRHWNLEASFSVGYARLNYKKYGPEKGDLLKEKSKVNYFGPTQLGLTFIYII